MLKSVQVMKRVAHVISISSFLLFLVLFVLFVGERMSGLFAFDFFYLCCFGVVCGGVVLSGLLVGVLLREMYAEVMVEERKETAVRTCYRYHELRSDPRMDN